MGDQLVIQGVSYRLPSAWALAVQHEINVRCQRAKNGPSELTVARFRASTGGSAFRESEGVEPGDIVQIAHSVAVDVPTRVAAVKYLEAHEPELAAKYRVAESQLDPALDEVRTDAKDASLAMRK